MPFSSRFIRASSQTAPPHPTSGLLSSTPNPTIPSIYREVDGESTDARDTRISHVAESMRQMMASHDVEPVEHVVQDLINEWPYFIHYPTSKLNLVAALLGKLLNGKVLINRSMLISCRMILEGLKACNTASCPYIPSRSWASVSAFALIFVINCNCR
jgi:hypothetical protein